MYCISLLHNAQTAGFGNDLSCYFHSSLGFVVELFYHNFFLMGRAVRDRLPVMQRKPA